MAATIVHARRTALEPVASSPPVPVVDHDHAPPLDGLVWHRRDFLLQRHHRLSSFLPPRSPVHWSEPRRLDRTGVGRHVESGTRMQPPFAWWDVDAVSRSTGSLEANATATNKHAEEREKESSWKTFMVDLFWGFSSFGVRLLSRRWQIVSSSTSSFRSLPLRSPGCRGVSKTPRRRCAVKNSNCIHCIQRSDELTLCPTRGLERRWYESRCADQNALDDDDAKKILPIRNSSPLVRFSVNAEDHCCYSQHDGDSRD
jgi:hypothetical protein